VFPSPNADFISRIGEKPFWAPSSTSAGGVGEGEVSWGLTGSSDPVSLQAHTLKPEEDLDLKHNTRKFRWSVSTARPSPYTKKRRHKPEDSETATATVGAESDPRVLAERLFNFSRKPVIISRENGLIEKSLRRIYQIWKIFGFASEKEFNLSRSLRRVHYVHGTNKSMSAMRWAKTMKFLILSFWRYWRGLPYEHDKDFLEPLKLPGTLFCGRGDRFMKSIKERQPAVFEILLNTMLISVKGGLPRPDQECLDEKKVDWFLGIFTGTKEKPDEKLVTRIRSKVREVIGDKKVEWHEIYLQPRVPSTSANYINSRDKGGCVSTILSDPYYKEAPRLEWKMLESETSKIWTNSKDEKGSYVPRMQDGLPVLELIVNPRPIQHDFARMFIHSVNTAVDEDPCVDPVSLSEALKVRMITKCPPYLMFSMNSFIDPLRKLLAKNPVFELTGTPQEETLMDRMFPDPTRKFLSGDYTAATDNLHGWVSECIADELLETYYSEIVAFDPNWEKLLKKSLTGFVYEDESLGLRFDQKRGQLMGSVSSFPILCLANYALCRMAMELNPPDWQGLLVNGDDCVLEANDECYEEWKRLGSILGLSPSPGKVDHSHGRIQMNSRTFLPLVDIELANSLLTRSRECFYDVEDEINNLYYSFEESKKFDKSHRRVWWKVPLILAGAAMGLSRSSIEGGDLCDIATCDYEGSKRSFMFELDNAPRDLRRRAEQYFESTFKKNVFKSIDALRAGGDPKHQSTKRSKHICDNLIYNLPRRFGGLGLDGKPSEFDLKYACYQINESDRAPRVAKDWLFHDLLERVLKDVSVPARDIESDYGKMYWYILSNQRWNVFNDNFRDEVFDSREGRSYDLLQRQSRFLDKRRKKILQQRVDKGISEIRDVRNGTSYSIYYMGGYV
jgi:hypothetical protein